MVGTGGLEPPTSRLSGVRSNHLSYAPISKDDSLETGNFGRSKIVWQSCPESKPAGLSATGASLSWTKRSSTWSLGLRFEKRLPFLLRKEVIQPHLPIRLPCYDFTPIICPALDGSLPCGLGHRLRALQTFVV